MKKRDLMKDMEIVEKATPGPWFDYARYGESNIFGHEIRLRNEDGPILAEDVSVNNAQFIAEAREGWPEAIKRAIEAEKEVARLRAEIQRHIDLMMSAAELMSDDADPEQRAKATAYLTVAKNLRGILDGSKTE